MYFFSEHLPCVFLVSSLPNNVIVKSFKAQSLQKVPPGSSVYKFYPPPTERINALRTHLRTKY